MKSEKTVPKTGSEGKTAQGTQSVSSPGDSRDLQEDTEMGFRDGHRERVIHTGGWSYRATESHSRSQKKEQGDAQTAQLVRALAAKPRT